jgi:hypothetical protein
MKTPAEQIALHLTAAAIKRERNGTGNTAAIIRTHHNDTDKAGTTNTSSPDAYHALDHATPHPAQSRPRYLSLTTVGWASPNTPDGTPPSLHPERQRVALVSVIDLTTNSIASAVRFAAKNKRAHVSTDEATGTLAEALRAAARKFA